MRGQGAETGSSLRIRRSRSLRSRPSIGPSCLRQGRRCRDRPRAETCPERRHVGAERPAILDSHIEGQGIGLTAVEEVDREVEGELATDRVVFADEAVRVILPQDAIRAANADACRLTEILLEGEPRGEKRREAEERRLWRLIILEVAFSGERAVEKVRVLLVLVGGVVGGLCKRDGGGGHRAGNQDRDEHRKCGTAP